MFFSQRDFSKANNRRQNTTGQSLTEFALALPFLMLILIGILDLGRITATYVVITNAAREGARYGASHQTSGNLTGITNRAKAEATGSAVVDPTQMTIACVPSNCQDTAGNPLQVQVTYPFRFITTYVFAGMSTLNITANATFQIQVD